MAMPMEVLTHAHENDANTGNPQGTENIANKLEELLKDYETEEAMLDLLNMYMHTDEKGDPKCKKLGCDRRGYSILHLVAERNYINVAEKLLESGFDPLTSYKGDKIAIHVAIEKKFDDMAALIISKMELSDVHRMFGNGENFDDLNRGLAPTADDAFTLKYLIDNNKTFPRAIIAVLDTLKVEKGNGGATVHVKLLEEDGRGLQPRDNGFEISYHTVFQNIARKTLKEATNHPVLRMLIDYKWNMWCRRRFVLNFAMFLVSLFSLTFAVVTGAAALDVKKYNTRLHHARAFFELLAYISAVKTFIFELRQIKRHKLDYWKQFFNGLELLSSVLIVITLPMRYIHTNTHWFILAAGYMLWVLRTFTYAAVFSQTGAYAESLRQIITKDFTQFSVLFIVVNLAFGCTFLLVLRGEGSLHKHDETSTIWGIWFVGLRTMIEDQPVVEYTGADGYGTTGTGVILVFRTMTIVVLLNILIAQLSDTYQKIQSDAVKSVWANRAWIIARLERNEWDVVSGLIDFILHCGRQRDQSQNNGCFSKGNRERYYKEYHESVDLKYHQKKHQTELELIAASIDILEKTTIQTDLKTQILKSRQRAQSKQLSEIKEMLEELICQNTPRRKQHHTTDV